MTPLLAAAVGMFDGVHLGHRMLVERLCELSDARGLMPGIFTFVDHPKAVVAPERAPELLTTVAQRSRLLVECGTRSVVAMRFDQALRRLTAEGFMRLLRDRYGVRMLLVGFNHRFGSDRLTDFEDYRNIGCRLGIEVVQAPALDYDLITPYNKSIQSTKSSESTTPISSSLIRSLILQGDIPGAESLLGHPYVLDGRVVHGRALGRTIDFPTANIQPYIPNQLLPLSGAYAAWLTCRDGIFPAMVNIGTNPTVTTSSHLSIEAHVIGYQGDLYDLPVALTFKARLRDERRFPDLASLTSQLRQDRAQALAALKTSGGSAVLSSPDCQLI